MKLLLVNVDNIEHARKSRSIFDKLTGSIIDKQNRSRFLLFSIVKAGFTTFEWSLIFPSWIWWCNIDFGTPMAANYDWIFIRFWSGILRTFSRSISHHWCHTLPFLFENKFVGMPHIANNFVAFQILFIVEIDVENCIAAMVWVPLFNFPPLLYLKKNSAINWRFLGNNSSLKYVFEGICEASHPAILLHK
jgi:hypothetical protein